MCIYIYHLFSDRVGFLLHNIPSSGVLMKSIVAAFLRPDALPGVKHMRGMKYQIVLNIVRNGLIQICVNNSYTKPTLIYIVNRPLVASYDIPG